jgi:hypothetical protein
MEIKKKIIVCGDSFCAADTTQNRWHFSQLLEDRYGYDVTCLAQGGMSNVGICFQMREAIIMKPDYIVYNKTTPNRVCLVLNDNFYTPNGLKNFVYNNPSNASFGHPSVGNANSPIWSTVYQGLDKQTRMPIRKEQLEAIDQYLIHLFDYQLQEETDGWMIKYWHDQIVQKGIHPVCVSDNTTIGRPMYEFSRQNPTWNTNYHTDLATQEIIAENIHQSIVNV